MKTFISALSVLLLSLAAARAEDAPVALAWEELPALPDTIGFGGPIAGTHRGALIVAGGANFPDGPPWPTDQRPAGSKVWHDRIYVLENAGGQWHSGFRLPRPLAYAATVSTEQGVFVFGGESFGAVTDSATGETTQGNFPIADVLLLRWDPAKKTIDIVENALPPLPEPSCYHGAGVIDNVIYVVASHAKDSTSDRLDRKSFWSLDLSKSKDGRRWQSLDAWPGPARHKMAVAVQDADVDGVGGVTKCLFLISGSTWVNGPDGSPDLARFKHFTDGYRYDPASKTWQTIAELPVLSDGREIDLAGYAFDARRRIWRRLRDDERPQKHRLDELFKQMPRPAGAATAIGSGQSNVLLFSGATGRFITLDLPDRPLFPRDVLAYNTRTDSWARAGRMPLGVVTTSIVAWHDWIVIPSGEIRPGVRTPKVQAVRVTGKTPR